MAKKKVVSEKAFKELLGGILCCAERLDREMSSKESYEHGKRIAKIFNEMHFLCDSAMHSELNYSFDKIKKIKDKLSKLKELPLMNIERLP